jgi:2,3-bisphosphoglycerate-independent phosphoglycerate mutase
MRYVVFLGDGMADYPIKELGDRTPLQVADKPNIDSLAGKGRCGLLKTLPEGLPLGSDTANLSVLGYDPRAFSEGRGVLEAASMGIKIADDEVVLRCNVICVQDGKIRNHSAGHISSEEAAVLIKDLNKKFGSARIRFYPGVSYRHILVLKGHEFSKEVECTAPHDVLGTEMNRVLVRGDEHTSKVLNELIVKSNELLENHPINLKRAEKGEDKANYVWPWSPGRKPKLEKFFDKYGKKGAVISAVDLLQGIGVCAGFDVIKVKGATGLVDTNYEGKSDAVIKGLESHDFVYCHVEASDEASHQGDYALKVKTIEYFDKRLVWNVLRRIDEIRDDVAIAVLTDHFTPCAKRTHTAEPVPFLIYNPMVNVERGVVKNFDEESCRNGTLGILEGGEFIRQFFSQPEADSHNM